MTSYECYEIGWGAVTGWKAITDSEDIPPFRYVEDLLLQKIAYILEATNSDEYVLYLTEGRTFRYDVAVTKPYKGTRKENKPWHYDNLTAYMKGVLPTKVVTHIEADDALAIDALKDVDNTIICSRDKDLRQIPCNFFSWELGKQPAFGPLRIDEVGSIKLSPDRKDIKGTGFAFFCAQMLIGDKADNIPGLEGCGPVAAMEILRDPLYASQDCEDTGYILEAVHEAYKEKYIDDHQARIKEQATLLWILRKEADEEII